MFKRVVSALVFIAIAAACFIISTETTLLLVAVCALISCNELANALEKIDMKPVKIIPFIFIVMSILTIYFKLNTIYLIAVVAVLIISAFTVCMKSEKYTAKSVIGTLFMLVYPGLPLLGVTYVCNLPSPDWIIIFLTGLLSAISCDTFALFGGMAFGKHKLAPTVSPKKTIEGSISGMAVTVGIAAAAWFLFKEQILLLNCNLWMYMLTALICTVTSQIGDLSASFIKREVGIKDFGNLIPGHGGMLDRIDSIMFSVPTAYIILTIIKGIRWTI